MRSLIILEVEHEDDISLLSEWVENIGPTPNAYPELTITNYAVKVDLPECFVLDSRNDGQGTCQSHTDIHAFNDDCVGFRDTI